MAIEIERKFLVKSDDWRAHVQRSKRIVQAYLAISEQMSVRVRVVDERDATLTIKSRGASTGRLEFEYQLPLDDARTLLELRVGSLLTKVRHIVQINELTWEIDVFSGENAGLVLAEVELQSAAQAVTIPSWIGDEVSHDERYTNGSLALRPMGRSTSSP